MEELAESALKSGAKTLIAVGDDQLFLQMLEVVVREPQVVLGYIPLAPKSEIADIVGISGIQEACRVIAQRRVREFDLGLVNHHHFFTQIKFGNLAGQPLGILDVFSKVRFLEPQPVTVRVDNSFSIFTNILAGAVSNAQPARPAGGKLDLVLVGKLGGREFLRHRRDLQNGNFGAIPGATILRGRNFEIDGPKTMPVDLGYGSSARLPLSVALAEEKVKILVAKSL